jgi:Ca2+-binding RTX toxin-like protein
MDATHCSARREGRPLGRARNDQLNGGKGKNDVCRGGTGADSFVFCEVINLG